MESGDGGGFTKSEGTGPTDSHVPDPGESGVALCMHNPTRTDYCVLRCSSTLNCTALRSMRCAYSPVYVGVPQICNRRCARGRADMRLSQPSLLSTAAPRRGPLWCPRSANVQSPCVMPALLAALYMAHPTARGSACTPTLPPINDWPATRRYMPQ